MQIVIISDNYPSNNMPNRGAFVYNLVQELSYYHTITVVAPFKIHDLFKFKSKKRGYGVERCRVYRPLYLSLSNKMFLGINLGSWTRRFKAEAVRRRLNRFSVKPDVIYSHFVSNAQTALAYAKWNSIPLVVASGESSYLDVAKDVKVDFEDLNDCIKHFICVSEANKIGLKKLGFDEDKMTIIPNTVDYTLFKPLDKKCCKKKLGIPEDKFVVGFVGHFIHRKGPNRIIEAIETLDYENIRLVCVGGGGNLISNNFTKVVPPVPNYQLPEIYNAFDIFVLPTINEGHCNVIEEAKACCIPIISSKGTTVEKQIDDQCGTMVDPLSISEIAKAINSLRYDENKRTKMRDFLHTERNKYTLSERGAKISAILERANKERRDTKYT